MSTEHLKLPEWMNTPQTRILFEVFGEDIRYVGGCVRNALLDRNPTDIDMACRLLPYEVQLRLQNRGLKVIPTGLEHGTLTTVIDGIPFEITSLRQDVETDGRRAVVTFTDSWEQDARRRDFTMNALYADQDGNVYDYTKQGIDDLKARNIRFVGNAARRIDEDYLRILRFFRFHAYYGSKDMDQDALKACADAANNIHKLSKERITQETLKILSAPDPDFVIEAMAANAILPDVVNDGCDMAVMKRYTDNGRPNPFARLVLLMREGEKNLKRMEHSLLFSRSQRQDLTFLIEGQDKLSDLSENAIKQLIYHYDNALAVQVYLVFCAKNAINVNDDFVALLEKWQCPAFPHAGEELIAKGYKPGPALGQRLKELEAEWLQKL